MSKTLVIILGPHAVGKMTVGQELAKITDLRLFHNHMSIELARKLFAHSEKEWRILNESIRQTVFELFAKGDFPGLIFTYMCAFDMQSEFDYLQNVIDLFKSNGANCYVVELCADFEERLVRNKSENRLLHKASKRDLEWSEAEMRRTSEKYRLNSTEEDKLPFENYLKIDNTNLPPREAAEMIKAHFGIGE
ncbi:MAG: shikimate kinase [Clostridia bacterium]|nr:shikimate kinase [Clostridia bacterium]